MTLKYCSITLAVLAGLAVSATAGAAPNAAAGARAKNLIERHPGWVNRTEGDAFVQREALVDSDGTEHVRFERTWNGLPMIGGDVVIHSRGGNLLRASHTLMTNQRPAQATARAARLDADAAIIAAGARFGTKFVGVPTARQVVYARGDTPALAYETVFVSVRPDQTPTEMHYIVDAGSGAILDAWDTVMTANAAGTGRTLFSGSVGVTTNSISGGYEMRDNSRGGNYVTDLRNGTSGSGTIFTSTVNTWGTGSTSNRASAASDALYGVSTTWDYFKNIHGRSGIANNGKGALSKVHYGSNYVNAFWSDSTFSMSYGDGDGVSYYPLVNLDVAGHEMSHGVTSRSAGLVYSGESGGLNEATSDIFGTMVEYYANNSYDRPDYLIGEKIYVNNTSGTKAMRYMFKPSLDGRSPDCYSSTLRNLDVHYSSGVANHFFYLLAEGAVTPSGFTTSPSAMVCNGNTAAGRIGRSAAQRIWYRALTVYLTSSSTYAGARSATLKAAADLYGSTSTQYKGVASAWSAVSVN